MVYRLLFKTKRIKEPGKRGGIYWITPKGEIRYGTKKIKKWVPLYPGEFVSINEITRLMSLPKVAIRLLDATKKLKMKQKRRDQISNDYYGASKGEMGPSLRFFKNIIIALKKNKIIPKGRYIRADIKRKIKEWRKEVKNKEKEEKLKAKESAKQQKEEFKKRAYKKEPLAFNEVKIGDIVYDAAHKDEEHYNVPLKVVETGETFRTGTGGVVDRPAKGVSPEGDEYHINYPRWPKKPKKVAKLFKKEKELINKPENIKNVQAKINRLLREKDKKKVQELINKMMKEAKEAKGNRKETRSDLYIPEPLYFKDVNPRLIVYHKDKVEKGPMVIIRKYSSIDKGDIYFALGIDGTIYMLNASGIRIAIKQDEKQFDENKVNKLITGLNKSFFFIKAMNKKRNKKEIFDDEMTILDEAIIYANTNEIDSLHDFLEANYDLDNKDIKNIIKEVESILIGGKSMDDNKMYNIGKKMKIFMKANTGGELSTTIKTSGAEKPKKYIRKIKTKTGKTRYIYKEPKEIKGEKRAEEEPEKKPKKEKAVIKMPKKKVKEEVKEEKQGIEAKDFATKGLKVVTKVLNRINTFIKTEDPLAVVSEEINDIAQTEKTRAKEYEKEAMIAKKKKDIIMAKEQAIMAKQRQKKIKDKVKKLSKEINKEINIMDKLHEKGASLTEKIKIASPKKIAKIKSDANAALKEAYWQGKYILDKYKNRMSEKLNRQIKEYVEGYETGAEIEARLKKEAREKPFRDAKVGADKIVMNINNEISRKERQGSESLWSMAYSLDSTKRSLDNEGMLDASEILEYEKAIDKIKKAEKAAKRKEMENLSGRKIKIAKSKIIKAEKLLERR